ncbi:MAG: serine hydrolase [Polyangiales bacterium]
MGLTGCASAAVGVDPPHAAVFDSLLEQAVAEGATGVGLYVSQPGHPAYLAGRGLAHVERLEPLTGAHLFRIASMTKPYLSALLVKLEVEGELSLEDPITQHLPDSLLALIPHAEQITIYDLLTHWSGISDYRDLVFSMDVLFEHPHAVRDEYTDLTDGLRRNPTPCAAPHLPPEQLTEALASCLDSNSNYVLAGYIVDHVLYGVEPQPGVRPQHHSRAFREQLFAPLGLEHTYYEKHLLMGEDPYPLLAHGYFTLPNRDGTVDADAPKTDVTDLDDGYGHANGALLASLADVAKFRRAVLDDDQVFPMRNLQDKQRFLARYTQLNPLGVAPSGSYADGRWHMTGDLGGYTSRAEYDPVSDTIVVLYSNDRDFEPQRDALVARIQAVIAGER